MTKQFHAVCFDHDGTLVDSEPIHYRLWRDVLADHRIELTEAEYKARYAGVPTLANAHDFVARHRLPVTADALSDRRFGYQDFHGHGGCRLLEGDGGSRWRGAALPSWTRFARRGSRSLPFANPDF